MTGDLMYLHITNGYCDSHGKRLRECPECCAEFFDAALAAEREAILSAPGRDEEDFENTYRAWWDKYYRPLRDAYPQEASIRARGGQ